MCRCRPRRPASVAFVAFALLPLAPRAPCRPYCRAAVSLLLLLLLLPLLLLLLPIQAVLLPRGLGRSGEALRTSIEFKNAVDASYFSHCTSGFVPPDAHVVLVEVNMQ